MARTITRTDYFLWMVIVIYTGIIYATLSLVSKLRKLLTEKYGYDVFDQVYWIFGAIGLFFLFMLFRKYKGMALLKALLSLLIVVIIYLFYLWDMKYAVERIHFLEYGVLGALIYMAFARHFPRVVALVSAVLTTFWLGMGDEYIQFLLPNRVGEVRDSVINLISGILGIALVWEHVSYRKKLSKSMKDIKRQYIMICILMGITSIFVYGFIVVVHGFGYRHQSKEPGIFYSSFTLTALQQKNNGDKFGDRKEFVYQNEAARHLLQREYYCSNDFMGADGTFYKRWDKCYWENEILEQYYSSFLKESMYKAARDIIAPLDLELADCLGTQKVLWTDSIKADVKKSVPESNQIFKSRVKSTIITSFKHKDLFFYILVLFVVLVMSCKQVLSLKE
ncbi:MAG: VanZ family protein [Fibrobacteria bacterium]|nr:VanZ family protein [Fibrobacteria bacterium]